jgi:pyruvate formate lyase activating enzyme
MAQLSKTENEKAECLLCPHLCKLAPGKTGICGVRQNTGNKVELLTYGVISGYALDPVEKKPLYHFFPGNNILSLGSCGCNMRCDFCQNYNISQITDEITGSKMTPKRIVIDALKAERNIGLAFTYNEPIVWFEFMRDTALLAKNAGLYTVMVSNGYINPDPLQEIIGFIDAFNIDLKAFNANFYKRLTGADIQPVKNSLKKITESGKHLEITTLIIPGQNDSEEEMALEAEWIAGELGQNTPLHLSRYFPMYRRKDPATSKENLMKLCEIASKKLKHVYVGNLHSDTGQDTICHGCGITVTIRTGYNTRLLNINNEGCCTKCGSLIYRNFIPASRIKS